MRRLFWMGVGAAAGASSTVWAQRRVRRHLDELGPEHVVAVAGRGARAVGRSVAGAVADALGEGRSAMTERELELRERLLGGGALPVRPRGDISADVGRTAVDVRELHPPPRRRTVSSGRQGRR